MTDTEQDKSGVLEELRKLLPSYYKNVSLAEIPPEDILDAWNKLKQSLSSNNLIDSKTKDNILNISFLAHGSGGYVNRMQTVLSCLDQSPGSAIIEPTSENYGITFITRPRLCLRSSNLRNTRTMTALDTTNNTTVAFMIRALLDTNLINAGKSYSDLIKTSPLIDYQNPFLVPLCNTLTSFNGAPDITLATMTTDGGYMSEAQTFAIGGDNLMRSGYSITCTFRDILYSPIMAIFYYWVEYIRCVTRGIMLAYPDDIDQQIINYTVSFYRFVLDPTRRYITKWAKFTGCFPTGLPIGGMFNLSEGVFTNTASKEISVNFLCNRVEYMDYAILMDFNKLIRRYCPTINKVMGSDKEHEPDENGRHGEHIQHPNLTKSTFSNFRGLPYITSDKHGIRLEYRQVNNPIFTNNTGTDVIVKELLCHELQMQVRHNTAFALSQADHYTPELLSQSFMANKDLVALIKKLSLPEN